ncbi:Hypothetical predicted protein [Paramuricea clavata]|uniref:Uncharacterized protein n=1 Tax=Paramuricea clavata TaxID=317549 RepID=A0A7D9HF78_PARCT|nr:Hypothetical predicted protein [Paramuricea clavata]
MDTKSEKSAKKFSFRKRRSSKGKKEGELQPVDLETEQQATVATQNCDDTPEKASGIVEQEFIQTPTNTVEDNKATESSGEDPGQKSTGESASGGKKKSKRRSLFKRNSKKSSVDESCELRVKESENTGEKSEEQKDESGEGSVVASTVENVMSSVEQGQVVCEKKQGEITEQSDGEGYLSVGEASEAEGEALFDGGKGSSPESVIVEGDKGTKRKSFFKRGLSLKRRKSKKQTSESKEDSVTTEQPSNDETQTEATLESSGAAADINDQNAVKALTENSEGTEDINNESKTASDNMSSAMAKQLPVKPARKVSFIGPDGTRLDSSDEGDSPTELPVETGDESDEDTITGEDGPSEVPEKVSEIVAPEVVVMAENTECSESFPEGDDDDLTEVSSLASDLLTSSDAPDTISTSDTSRLFTLTDTDDNGSRITLEEISEESEAEPKMEIIGNVPEGETESNVGEESGTQSKPEVAGEEIASEGTESKQEVIGTGFESRPEASEKGDENKFENEATRLLGDGDASKIGEWEMVNKSHDMSVELSRVRKQTLFGVKRLCCSVM